MTEMDRLEKEMEAAIERGDTMRADEIYDSMRWICGKCGNGAAEEQYVGGIYAGRMCETCFKASYKQDWRHDYLDAGEYLEEEDY